MYRESLEVVSADLRKAQQRIQRSALLSSPGGSAASRPLDFDKSLDARTRMQQNTDKLQGGTSVLDAAHGTLEEVRPLVRPRIPARLGYPPCMDWRRAQFRFSCASPPTAQTLTIATGSMDELGRNRETLNRVRSNVGVVSSTMDEARRIIRSEWMAGRLASYK